MVQSQRLYGESRYFSEEAANYGYDPVHHMMLPLEPGKEKIGSLRQEIADRVKRLSPNEVLSIAFAGYPGVGKTSQLGNMVSIAADSLGGGKSPLLSFTSPTPGAKPTLAGRIARDGRVGVAHGDHTFPLLGPDRRNLMLLDMPNFQKYFGDDEKLARIFWNIVAGNNPNDKIYCGSPEERGLKKPLGSIQLHENALGGEKNVMFVEGVQAIRALNAIEAKRGKYQLKVLKILFDVSVLDSLIRLLRRDRNQKFHADGSPYTFEEILEHRLIEHYYIFETYIAPAYQDESVILLDKPREMPPFRESERQEILAFLRKFKPKSPHRENPDLVWFVAGRREGLLDYFSNVRTVSEREYTQWKVARDQKKNAQASSS